MFLIQSVRNASNKRTNIARFFLIMKNSQIYKTLKKPSKYKNIVHNRGHSTFRPFYSIFKYIKGCTSFEMSTRSLAKAVGFCGRKDVGRVSDACTTLARPYYTPLYYENARLRLYKAKRRAKLPVVLSLLHNRNKSGFKR